MHRTAITSFLVCVLLTACSPSSPPPQIAGDQREALEKAREAAATLEQSTRQTEQDIDEQTR